MIEVKALDDVPPIEQLVDWYVAGKSNWSSVSSKFHDKKMLASLLNDKSLFVEHHYLKGVYHHQDLIGVVIDYPIQYALTLNQKSHDHLKQELGVWGFHKHYSLYRKMARHLPEITLENQQHIHLFAIDTDHQNKGIGSFVLSHLITTKPNQMYSLLVDERNDRAIQFYLKHRFEIQRHGHIRYRNKWYGQYLMVRNNNNAL
ncbi:Acetyltransferase (GNAT) family protein [Pelagirhabdus alkalitolerans]|uniref:Acetyltransferase (GNAT) family protein n=1 Tax=Pelagirhabdus alkalitolerans TaxID=1612202 RepID=A0A1G6IP00_9BACI|nr:GNAT family N-acetyltransferase [Pelagirhabdus alkalitolerans]SDC07496.1 Acetyltransferase (GNAT) family protein [Pelagirhabdus alkalitolerans]